MKEIPILNDNKQMTELDDFIHYFKKTSWAEKIALSLFLFLCSLFFSIHCLFFLIVVKNAKVVMSIIVYIFNKTSFAHFNANLIQFIMYASCFIAFPVGCFMMVVGMVDALLKKKLYKAGNLLYAPTYLTVAVMGALFILALMNIFIY